MIIDYQLAEGWFVGFLRGYDGVFSQGKTLNELNDNIREVYTTMTGRTADNSAQLIEIQEGRR